MSILPKSYISLMRALITKAFNDVELNVTSMTHNDVDRIMEFRVIVRYQVITEGNPEFEGIEWRFSTFTLRFDWMGIHRTIADNHYDTMFKGIQDQTRKLNVIPVIRETLVQYETLRLNLVD